MFILFSGMVMAQNNSTKQTYKLGEGVEPAAGTLEDVFLVGRFLERHCIW